MEAIESGICANAWRHLLTPTSLRLSTLSSPAAERG